MKATHSTMVGLSGLIWFAIGIMLLPLGFRLLLQSTFGYDFRDLPLLAWVSLWAGGKQNAALLLIAFGLWVGYWKNKAVLTKTAHKNIARILALPDPARLTLLFSRKYLILIAAMMGLGVAIKVFEVPMDVRGMIDVAVGSALINGSAVFFRSAWSIYQNAVRNCL